MNQCKIPSLLSQQNPIPSKSWQPKYNTADAAPQLIMHTGPWVSGLVPEGGEGTYMLAGHEILYFCPFAQDQCTCVEQEAVVGVVCLYS